MTLKTLTPLLVAFAFMSAGCGGDTSDDAGDSTPDAEVTNILALSGDVSAGSSVFTNTCAACHGADGDSGYADDLTSAVPSHSDTQIVETIIYGEGSMPAQGSLSDQEVADALAYCRDTFGG